jgi:hypothetical protein
MDELSRPGSGARSTHDQLNQLLDRVLRLRDRGDLAGVLEAWRVFEAETRLHLAVEESRLVPAFARHDPTDAAIIELEHDAIREALRVCRHALERGEPHATTLDAIIAAYRDHQVHEEETMYAWARD